MNVNITRPILLVEDDPLDVDLTRRAFSRRNLANPLLVFRDGEEALTYIQTWKEGDLVPVAGLLDLKLPKVDGLDVLQAFKSHWILKTMPLVVLTSSAEDRDIQIAYERGANSYIVKPVDFEKFIDITAQIELYWLVLNTPPR